ncbi:hypothetical protein T492DRAFT_111079 [Pavlovales sp. CCMP2436]|nr:hypothetical protein T492DRAFT_111079 [Pavlovales sp. CCMP2436]
MEDRAEEDEREDEHEGEDENKQLLAHSSDAGGRTRASGRWCALGLLLALLAVACAAFTAWRPPASAPTLPNPASAGVLEYAAWPRPQTELATETLTALGLDRPFEFKAVLSSAQPSPNLNPNLILAQPCSHLSSPSNNYPIPVLTLTQAFSHLPSYL